MESLMAAHSARAYLGANKKGVTPALLPDIVANGPVARDNEGEGGVIGWVSLAGGDAAPKVRHIVGEGWQIKDSWEVCEGRAE